MLNHRRLARDRDSELPVVESIPNAALLDGPATDGFVRKEDTNLVTRMAH